jgi:orotate phosphoribosyltransferase
VTREDIEELHRLMQHCFKHDGPYHLSSGLVSNYYYDGKLGTLHPPTAWLAANILVDVVLESGAEAVGGRETGSIPISDAIGIAAHLKGHFLPSFFVRKTTKDHGTRSDVAQAHFDGEELLVPGRRVALVDDVITTGGSIQDAIDAVENKGCIVTAVFTLVERHESKGTALRGRPYPVLRIFYTDDDGRLFIDEEFVRRAEVAASSRVLSR